MYDFLFITSLPSFYKINLYNELARKCHIYVVFLSAASDIRAADFFNAEMQFEYCVLDTQTYEKRNCFSNSLKIIRLMQSIKFSRVVVGGWDAWEYWAVIVRNNKAANAAVVESSLSDSTSSGVKGLIKKFFISRLSMVFVSGSKHKALLNALGFSGEIVITGGVGLINRNSTAKVDEYFHGHFLYVGRLSQEKNLHFLVSVFKQFKHFKLTILGQGPLEQEIKQLADDNIQFIRNKPNHEIDALYLQHDVLLLLSHREPWGLVIEEALYYGLPVIVSQQVGCVPDLVDAYGSGIVVDGNNKQSLAAALLKMSQQENYQTFHNKVSQIDFEQRVDDQINCYLAVIKSNDAS